MTELEAGVEEDRKADIFDGFSFKGWALSQQRVYTRQGVPGVLLAVAAWLQNDLTIMRSKESKTRIRLLLAGMGADSLWREFTAKDWSKIAAINKFCKANTSEPGKKLEPSSLTVGMLLALK